MATTSPKTTSKSSTKSKAKTNVKTSTKAVKTNSKVTTKPVEVKAAKRASRVIDSSVLERFHRFSAVIYAALALVAAFIMNNSAIEEFVSHLTSDPLRSVSETVFAPAITVLYEMPVKWVVVALLLFSAVFSFVRARRFKAKAPDAIARNLVPARWVDFGVSFAIIIYILALITGIQDIVTIKLLSGMFIIAAGFGWIADRENFGSPRFVKGAYWGGVFAATLTVLALATTSLATLVNGMVRSPWYVYVAHIVFILGLVLWYRNQRNSYRQDSVPAVTEYRYLWVSYATKVLLVITLIFGLQK